MAVTRTPRRASVIGGMTPWALAVALLAGCALAPAPSSDDLRHEVLPDTDTPPQWTAGPTTAGEVAGDWLATFQDPQLEALVKEAIAHNADLRVAAARVEQAAAYTRIAGGELYPKVDLLARGGGEMSGDNSGLEGVLVSASWELDLWGRVRYTRRAATDQYASAEADFVYARQSLAAQVAKSWFLATEAALQRQLLSEIVTAATKLLELADHRWDVGIGSEFDVASAKVNLQTYQDRQREIELAYEQAIRALELLVGRYPAAEIAARAEFGALPPPIPAGLPSELLERRPDVIAAQKRVAAAFSRVKESQAARLPRISLTGSVSDLTSELFVLQERDNPVWSIGGAVFAPLFTGGALKGQVEVRTAEQEQAVAQYVKTALAAFGDVENALSSEFALEDRETILAAAVNDAARALELAEIRYRVGSGDLRAVEQQQLAYHSSRMNLLRVQSERRVQRVNLHLALGGDFAASA